MKPRKLKQSVDPNSRMGFRLQQLDAIRTMRKNTIAPVDTMGCYALASREAAPKTFRFQTLVALMLSSQTRDEVTAAAFDRLAPLSVDSIISIEEDALAALLCPVGFYRVKAKSLKKTAFILKEQYDSDIPPCLSELIKLPGVGPKMAHLTLQVAWGRTEGIGVDVHVNRICRRLHWVEGGKSPEDCRRELEDWLPREHWREINPLLVGFGQTICLPVKPKCESCLLCSSCPSSKVKTDPES